MQTSLKTAIIFLVIIFQTTPSASQLNNDSADAYTSVTKGIELMNDGKYSEAMIFIDRALELDPGSMFYRYEKALCHYQLEEYHEAVEILDSLKNHKDAVEQVYQLLGNCCDFLDEKKKAFYVYKDGLKKFPNSGRLYMEIGKTTVQPKNNKIAVGYWETGVTAEPRFPSNYYYLAGHYIKTAEKIWAVQYGEIHQNIAGNISKFQKMGKLLFDAYNSAFFTYVDSVRKISFTRVIVKINPKAKGQFIPYQTAFQTTIDRLPEAAFFLIEQQASIEKISAIRKAFVKEWYENKYNENFPNPLFQRHKELIEKNYFEAYDYWMMNQGAPEEFERWLENNREVYNNFLKWQNDNPLELTPENYFQRSKYE